MHPSALGVKPYARVSDNSHAVLAQAQGNAVRPAAPAAPAHYDDEPPSPRGGRRRDSRDHGDRDHDRDRSSGRDYDRRDRDRGRNTDHQRERRDSDFSRDNREFGAGLFGKGHGQRRSLDDDEPAYDDDDRGRGRERGEGRRRDSSYARDRSRDRGGDYGRGSRDRDRERERDRDEPDSHYGGGGRRDSVRDDRSRDRDRDRAAPAAAVAPAGYAEPAQKPSTRHMHGGGGGGMDDEQRAKLDKKLQYQQELQAQIKANEEASVPHSPSATRARLHSFRAHTVACAQVAHIFSSLLFSLFCFAW